MTARAIIIPSVLNLTFENVLDIFGKLNICEAENICYKLLLKKNIIIIAFCIDTISFSCAFKNKIELQCE